MTKKELLNKLDSLLDARGMEKIEDLDGKIGAGSTKSEITSAIKCLEASDDEMKEYLNIIRKEYPNTCEKITSNGNWLTHSFNRFYVFSSAKSLLACGVA